MVWQQYATSAFGAGTQTATFSGSRKPQAGNLLIASGWANTNEDLTLGTSTGWTDLGKVSADGTRQLHVWYKTSDGTEITTTMSGGSGNMWLLVHEWAGFQGVLDGSANNSNSASSVSSLATGAISTVYQDSLVIAIWALFGASPTGQAVTNGATHGGFGYQSVVEYYPGATLAGYQNTMTWSTSNICCSKIVAFQASRDKGFFALM